MVIETDNRFPVTKGAMPGLSAAADPLEATYEVAGRQIQLYHGKASQPAAPGSATMIETSVFGRPQYGDLNGDGLDDAVFFLRHDPGGSGSFFYVAAAVFIGHGWQGTRTMFLGDRIIPRGIEIRDGVIIVTYLGRRSGDPLSMPATVGLSKRLIMRDHQLADYVQ